MNEPPHGGRTKEHAVASGVNRGASLRFNATHLTGVLTRGSSAGNMCHHEPRQHPAPALPSRFLELGGHRWSSNRHRRGGRPDGVAAPA